MNNTYSEILKIWNSETPDDFAIFSELYYQMFGEDFEIPYTTESTTSSFFPYNWVTLCKKLSSFFTVNFIVLMVMLWTTLPTTRSWKSGTWKPQTISRSSVNFTTKCSVRILRFLTQQNPPLLHSFPTTDHETVSSRAHYSGWFLSC